MQKQEMKKTFVPAAFKAVQYFLCVSTTCCMVFKALQKASLNVNFWVYRLICVIKVVCMCVWLYDVALHAQVHK